MSYEGLVSNEVLATEQQRLEAEKHQAQHLLEAAELHANDIETALDGAFAKTETPHATYLSSTPLERRLLNQTFFKRILVGDEGTIKGAELTTVYAALATWEPSLGRPRHLTALPTPAKGSNKKNPDPVFRGQGSHNDVLVDAGEQRSNMGLPGAVLGLLAPVLGGFGLPEAGVPGGQGFVDGGQLGPGDLAVFADFDTLEDGAVHHAAL